MNNRRNRRTGLFILLMLLPFQAGCYIPDDVFWLEVVPLWYFLIGAVIINIGSIIKIVANKIKPSLLRFDQFEVGTWLTAVLLFFITFTNAYQYFDNHAAPLFPDEHLRAIYSAKMFFSPVLIFLLPISYSLYRRKAFKIMAMSFAISLSLLVIACYHYLKYKDIQREWSELDYLTSVPLICEKLYDAKYEMTLAQGFRRLAYYANANESEAIKVVEHFRNDRRVEAPVVKCDYMLLEAKVYGLVYSRDLYLDSVLGKPIPSDSVAYLTPHRPLQGGNR